MKNQYALVTSAITGLLAIGLATSAGMATAADNEKCFGIAKAGQNGCNSNANKHSCAGHSKIDNDPSDFTLVPTGSCSKVGGKLAPAANKPTAAENK